MAHNVFVGESFLYFVVSQYIVRRYPAGGVLFWRSLTDGIHPLPLAADVGSGLVADGAEATEKVIVHWLETQVDYPSVILRVHDGVSRNPVLRVQQLFVARGWPPPVFRVGGGGPPVVVELLRGGVVLARGEGPTRKRAECAAALHVLNLEMV